MTGQTNHEMKRYKVALKMSVDFRLRTPLLLRSGQEGEFADSAIEKTPEGHLHVNGYVWAGLLRRAIQRVSGGETLAGRIGKYDESSGPGVSPLWCESSFAMPLDTDIKPGNRLSRMYGSAEDGALYSDELVPPGLGLAMSFNYFAEMAEDVGTAKAFFLKTLRVIHDGIENIGGGWSYGLGRLDVIRVRVRNLDLTKAEERALLWNFDDLQWDEEMNRSELPFPELFLPYKRLRVKAHILPGQLMAIHSGYPAFDTVGHYFEYPDTFIYRQSYFDSGSVRTQVVIPGKTIRQALFVVPLERKLRTTEPDAICDTVGGVCSCSICKEHRNASGKKNEISPKCECKRCRWFGSTGRSGIIAVSDAVVHNPDAIVLSRVQLCEHSMQNIQLFSGEYLRKADFEFDILVDYTNPGGGGEELLGEIDCLLEDIAKDSNAPPGWHRLGATSTCTGQVEIEEIREFEWADEKADEIANVC